MENYLPSAGEWKTGPVDSAQVIHMSETWLLADIGVPHSS